MLKVKCPFCGTRDHHQSEMHLCSAMKASSKESKDESTPDASDRVCPGDRDTDPSPPEQVGVVPGSKSDRLAVAKEALTNAERCRRYREKHRERVLKADRTRKAKIRGSPSE